MDDGGDDRINDQVIGTAAEPPEPQSEFFADANPMKSTSPTRNDSGNNRHADEEFCRSPGGSRS